MEPYSLFIRDLNVYSLFSVLSILNIRKMISNYKEGMIIL